MLRKIKTVLYINPATAEYNELKQKVESARRQALEVGDVSGMGTYRVAFSFPADEVLQQINAPKYMPLLIFYDEATDEPLSHTNIVWDTKIIVNRYLNLWGIDAPPLSPPTPDVLPPNPPALTPTTQKNSNWILWGLVALLVIANK
ncbi:MAG: hypothetical protein AAGI23_09450 [Bacteroidota bacterium]